MKRIGIVIRMGAAHNEIAFLDREQRIVAKTVHRNARDGMTPSKAGNLHADVLRMFEYMNPETRRGAYA